jgi:hypothetical protein
MMRHTKRFQSNCLGMRPGWKETFALQLLGQQQRDLEAGSSRDDLLFCVHGSMIDMYDSGNPATSACLVHCARNILNTSFLDHYWGWNETRRIVLALCYKPEGRGYYYYYYYYYKQTNSVAPSPRANYTDWATANCRRNLVPTFADRGVSRGQCSGSRTVVNLSFLDRGRYFSFK